jgi:phage-related minor tail protein
MSAPDFPSQPATGTDLENRVRSDAADLAETARHDIEDVTNQVKQEAAALGDEAKAQLADAAEKAKGMAEEQKQLLVDQLDGVSSSLDKVAGELEEQGEGTARYVRMVADGASKLTSTVRDNNVDDMLAMAEDFGRKQPVAFMGAAALLGFVASRFLVASASRRAEAAGQGRYQAPTAPSSYAAGTMSPGRPSYEQSVGGNDAGI